MNHEGECPIHSDSWCGDCHYDPVVFYAAKLDMVHGEADWFHIHLRLDPNCVWNREIGRGAKVIDWKWWCIQATMSTLAKAQEGCERIGIEGKKWLGAVFSLL